MKKIVLAALLTSAVGLMADGSGVYVGVDLGNTAADVKISFNGTSETGSDDGGSQTFKLGYYFDTNNRASVFYQNINADGADASNVGIGYDYLIGDNDLKPFVGLMLGHGSFNLDDFPVDIAGMTYGAQFGLNYTVQEGLSFEAGYRYLRSSMEDSISGPGGTAKVEINPLTNWFVGANYKF